MCGVHKMVYHAKLQLAHKGLMQSNEGKIRTENCE